MQSTYATSAWKNASHKIKINTSIFGIKQVTFHTNRTVENGITDSV